MTVKIHHAIKYASCMLKYANLDSANLDARLLMQDLLKVSHEKLICIQDDYTLQPEVYKKYLEKINLRMLHKPISQIIGFKNFWDEKLIITQKTLTPRPDTETIIDAVLDQYKNKNKILKILDIGCGTGCIINTLLKIYKNSIGFAIDINNHATHITNLNRKKTNINCKKIKIYCTNFDAFIKKHNNFNFDIIVSNPPYISIHDYITLDKTVKNYEPASALIAPNAGLQNYIRILTQIRKYKIKNKTIFFEIGNTQYRQIKNIVKNLDYKITKAYKDLGSVTRVVSVEKTSKF